MDYDIGVWNWLTQTNTGLAVRITAGVVIFASLAIVDFRKNGAHATRWREYLFLLLCVAVAMVYGIINDLITSSISWEYFYYGKGLSETLGDPPPDPLKLHLAATVVGMKATWTAGLLIGAVLLIANNPSRNRRSLPFTFLFRMLVLIGILTVLTAAVLGLIGSFGWLAHFSDDFTAMLRRDEMRPHRFIAVFGIHFGGYVGGLVGLIAAVLSIRKVRSKDFEPRP